MKPIFIIAFDHSLFLKECRYRGIPSTHARHISCLADVRILLGVENPRIIEHGSVHRMSEVFAIRRFVNERRRENARSCYS